MNIFAVVCHGNAKGLLDATREYGAQCSCLYNEPVDPNTFRNAPFLVEINEEIKPWFAELKDPWGIYLITKKAVTFNSLRKHLRKFTYVYIPTEKTPVLFRYYDPRVFWRFMDVVDDFDLKRFLEPVEIVASNYLVFKQAHFDERKSGKGAQKTVGSYLSFSDTQFEKFNEFYREDYIKKLSLFMMEKIDWELIIQDINDEYESEYLHYKMLKHQKDLGRKISHPLDLELLDKEGFFVDKFRPLTDKDELMDMLAKDVFYFLKGVGIHDDRSIKMFSVIVTKLKIYRFIDIPEGILSFLKRDSDSSKGKVESLLDLINEEIGNDR